jgi:ferredoxin
MQQFLSLNRTLSAVWPVITARGQVPADAADWEGVDGKLRYLDLPEKVA